MDPLARLDNPKRSYRGIVMCSALAIGATLATAGEWISAAPMGETRQYPGLALLPDGRVLAVTGHPLDGKSIASAEIYDPIADAWEDTGAMNLARNGVQPNGLIVLSDTRVLISGSGIGGRSVHEAEIYDPKSGTWTETGSMRLPRTVHQTVRLHDGRVLAIGGIDWGSETVHASAEVYDYRTGNWSQTAAMSTPRFNHRAVVLRDGQVLVCGGNAASPVGDSTLDSVEIFEPSSGEWAMVNPMREQRYAHGLSLLNDGRVLVAGGAAAPNTPVASAEIYDPATGEWSDAGTLEEPRWGPTQTTLIDGTVLVVGGMRGRFGRSDATERFDPRTNTWAPAGKLQQQRNGHRAITLPDGRLLICGGFDGLKFLRSCEIYVP